MARPRRSLLPLLAFLLIVPVSALAQDPDSHSDAGTVEAADPTTSEEPSADGDVTERARAAFARGIACVEEHETACAEQAFREALALRDAPTVRYNLASALFDLGRYPEAARLTDSVIANTETPPDVRGHAETLRDQLRAQGATLGIALDGAAEGAEVHVDAEPIPASQLAEVVVAPGARVVTAHRDGEELARRELTVQSGAREAITLTIAPPVEEAVEPEEPATPAGTPLHEDPTFWAIVGGAAGVVVVVVVIAAIVAATAGVEGPIEGNYEPTVLRW